MLTEAQRQNLKDRIDTTRRDYQSSIWQSIVTLIEAGRTEEARHNYDAVMELTAEDARLEALEDMARDPKHEVGKLMLQMTRDVGRA